MELRARLRARVVEEIIHTEQSYLADLRILVAQFLVPLRDRIAPGDLVKIFSNLEVPLREERREEEMEKGRGRERDRRDRDREIDRDSGEIDRERDRQR